MFEKAAEPAKRPQPGDRVCAVLYADEEKVGLLGYGVYEGRHNPPFGPFGSTREEYDAVMAEMKASGDLPSDHVDPFTVPKITLDNGDVVWGTDVWWGAEEKMKAWIGQRTIVPEKISQK